MIAHCISKLIFLVMSLCALMSIGCSPNNETINSADIAPAEDIHDINSALLLHAQGEKNLETYDQVCDIVSKKFFDPDFKGVDWDGLCAENRLRVGDTNSRSELAILLNEMLSLLKTSHTSFYTPDDKNYFLLFDVFGYNPNLDVHRKRLFGDKDISFEGIGIFTIPYADKIFVSDIVEGSPASKTDLKVGDEILSVDDKVFHPIDSFRGKAGKTVELQTRRTLEASVSTMTIPVKRLSPSNIFQDAMRTSARLIETDGLKIGYIHIWSSAGQKYEDILREMVQAGPLSKADAIIMDIRGKIGGGGLNYLNILDQHSLKLTVKGRGFSVDQTSSFKGKTVWIIDEGVRSSAELLAHAIRKENFGPMIGENTAGAVTGGSPNIMPDDSLLYVAVAELSVDGKRLEGVGVEPDIEVPYSIPYSAGKDPQFEKALKEAIKLASP